MATRRFTVFQDTPSGSDTNPPPRKPVRASSVPLTRSASNASVLASDTVAIDKENYNPLTGQRTQLNISTGEKKRKTTILTPKTPVLTSSSKKQKTSEPDLKKRKAGSSKSKLSGSKDGKISGSGKKAKRSSPTRRASPLPKVIEESTNDAAQGLSQAAIDSRCYELTVTPLADVSEAYEAVASAGELIHKPEQGPFQTAKESSVEPELRDYFCPTNFLSSLVSSRLGHLAEDDDTNSPHQLSTPERKKIYASFTFSSPSPSSKRFRETYDLRPGSPTPKKSSDLSSAAPESAIHEEALKMLHS